MSASKYCQTVEIEGQRGSIQQQKTSVSSEFGPSVSSSEIHHVKLAFAVSFGHHP